MVFKKKLLILFLFFPFKLLGWGIIIDPFLGGQGLGTTSFTYIYQNGSTQYESRVWDYIYGSRLSYIFFEKGNFLINGGLEYYQGKEFNARYTLTDKWDKSNLGVLISMNWGDFFLRGIYYGRSQKTLIEDNNVGIGNLNDSLKGSGFGIGTGYKFFNNFTFNFDYRSLTYSKIGSTSLPSGSNSKIGDQEFSFSISMPINFGFKPITFGLKILKAKKRMLTKQIGSTQNDQAGAITVDYNDDILITGFTEGNLFGLSNEGESDVFLMKYSKKGKMKWAHIFGQKSIDIGNSLVVDEKNNVYLVGSTDAGVDGVSRPGNTDILLAKYDSKGRHLWSKQLWRPSNDNGYGVSLGIDGSIFVTGSTFKVFSNKLKRKAHHIIAIKYNSSGKTLWSKDLGKKGIGNAIEVNKLGYVYIVGTGKSLNEKYGNDVILIKLHPSGRKEWVHHQKTYSHDSGTALSLDHQGNIYILCSTETKTKRSSILLKKVDPFGRVLWSKKLSSNKEDFGNGIKIDSRGNIYITGYTSGSFTKNENMGGTDAFLLKLNSKGHKVWTKQFGTAFDDFGNTLTVDLLDNVIVSGSTFGGIGKNKNNGGSDIFFVKFNSLGEKL
jgi:hypothetical protein